METQSLFCKHEIPEGKLTRTEQFQKKKLMEAGAQAAEGEEDEEGEQKKKAKQGRGRGRGWRGGRGRGGRRGTGGGKGRGGNGGGKGPARREDREGGEPGQSAETPSRKRGEVEVDPSPATGPKKRKGASEKDGSSPATKASPSGANGERKAATSEGQAPSTKVKRARVRHEGKDKSFAGRFCPKTPGASIWRFEAFREAFDNHLRKVAPAPSKLEERGNLPKYVGSKTLGRTRC